MVKISSVYCVLCYPRKSRLTVSDPRTTIGPLNAEKFSHPPLDVEVLEDLPSFDGSSKLWQSLDALVFFYTEDPRHSTTDFRAPPHVHKIFCEHIKRRELPQNRGRGSLHHLEEGGKLYFFYHTHMPTLLKEKKSLFEEQTLIGDLLKKLQEFRAQKLLVDSFSLGGDEVLWQFLYSLAVASCPSADYKTEANSSPSLRAPFTYVVLPAGLSSEEGQSHIGRTMSFAASSNLVRKLQVEPPNQLTPRSFYEVVKQMSSERGLKFRFFSFEDLQAKGAGAFCAVAGAHPGSGAGILEVVYEPGEDVDHDYGPQIDHVCFVGKGITYDSGGVNVKPASYMRGMKNDMTGAAMALSMVLLAQDQKWSGKVSSYLAVADNLISAHSFKPDDVVLSYSGLTIEVVHSDAEGRMILADTLTLASESKPDVLIDFATLTGASVRAISRRYNSVYTNHPAWHPLLIHCGQKTGERVWPFPLDEDFAECLHSSVADTLQCSTEVGVDHIEAAMFLKKFIPKELPWLHMDLSNARTPQGAMGSCLSVETGFGARFVTEFLKSPFFSSSS